MNLLVTGGHGFIGQAACTEFVKNNIPVRMATRSGILPPGSPESFPCGEIGPDTDWSDVLPGITHVVHLAARVHRMGETSEKIGSEYRRVNVLGTERLARSAARAGVQRFVFMSTAKVHGEGRGTPYREDDPPHPEGPYPKSKWEAEKVLRRISAETGMEIVILRPPLVYGPGVKANFLRLMKAVSQGYPLPFGSVRSNRSFVFIGNLVDAILKSLDHPKAGGREFLVSDGEDLSTPELIRRIAWIMGTSRRLFPLPVTVLEIFSRLAGKREEIGRVTKPFLVDSSKIRKTLSWNPPFSLEEGLQETVHWFLNQKHTLS